METEDEIMDAASAAAAAAAATAGSGDVRRRRRVVMGGGMGGGVTTVAAAAAEDEEDNLAGPLVIRPKAGGLTLFGKMPGSEEVKKSPSSLSSQLISSEYELSSNFGTLCTFVLLMLNLD